MTKRFYAIAIVATVLTAGGFFAPTLYSVGCALAWLLLAATATDALLLWHRRGLTAERQCDSRFSNGDDNTVRLRLESSYPFPTKLRVTDEVPFIFQRRDVSFHVSMPLLGTKTIAYHLRPTQRGTYGFGHVRAIATSPLRLIGRRYRLAEPMDVSVYPSYLMLRRYELLAMSNRLTDMGIKRVRQVGHDSEFEQIREYVKGDDFRSLNWKATARRAALMTNVYQAERSQQVYCLIDKGRVMQQAFRQMTLLDYSINATLMLSYVATRKDDKAGLITFADRFGTMLPASKRTGQMQHMQEALYAEHTTFGESDYAALVQTLNERLTKRSLLILFTNFTGQASLARQLPYLRQLNKSHRLLVVFFEDSEMQEFVRTKASTTEDVYQHVIAEKMVHEQRHLVALLRQQGILALLTTPQQLSVDVVNKYLELKQRSMAN